VYGSIVERLGEGWKWKWIAMLYVDEVRVRVRVIQRLSNSLYPQALLPSRPCHHGALGRSLLGLCSTTRM
jgi:hypothetical protein